MVPAELARAAQANGSKAGARGADRALPSGVPRQPHSLFRPASLSPVAHGAQCSPGRQLL